MQFDSLSKRCRRTTQQENNSILISQIFQRKKETLMCLYLKSITLEVIRQIAGIKRRIRFVRPSAGSVHFGRIMMCFCSQSVQLTKSPCCSGISEPSLLTFLLSIHSTSLQRASNTAKKNCTRP